ncbi:3-hydroxyacyl-CoA dehydrogenase [Pseudonocardia halophobica]|uniref:3-hydroxyacyl-CoA dehydrogenase n=1 Tax=Pseudonocardia halophobica TaxID=29401 RepID=A0A9W6NVK6_9PSEU|nr:3-hydroxyacyl-CoA dehydrogenase [Pseudonocardia halophobica]GLL10646.1 3-hydroxyacyl-CoA dehydrogenase [Pseudonocardia halophobica]
MSRGRIAHVAVLGAGSIGVGFAVAFAAHGVPVVLWDPFPEALDRARTDLHRRLRLLADHGLAPGQAAPVRTVESVEEAASDAALVQECAPERVEVKRELLAAAATVVPAVPLASATSAILPSRIAEGMPAEAAARVLVAHPANPPYLLPVVELVPGPTTVPEVVRRADEVFRGAGMHPVLVHREVEGFVLNRLQGAVLREAYCLVRDGVASVADVDEVVRSALGRRWSVTGPFETADLNTRGGIASHADKLGPAYARMGAERGQHDPWTAELVSRVTAERRRVLPLDDWDRRVLWRDTALAGLTGHWTEIRRADDPAPSSAARDQERP